MEHRLQSVRAGVEHSAIAGSEALLLGDVTSKLEEESEFLGCRFGQRNGIGLVSLGNHENVRGRYGRDVAESQRVVTLGDDVSGDLAADDLAEQAVVRHEI